ncbi:MAG TPA: preprotein translocase subunit SecE [Lachnoclostridium phytofermentans]|uniref:Protein translocase subunit SecE n=1 Tax=Lachnoclostridium phytofermentans TaxID=66219 RepID=A0A3D2X189_9FIRM|nr:preprotein translocase subunit SecE [Lachnoclostridium sp.]HCL00919.1 preprotein translocase subunit SecE [Lachnoclostridium phytofermentans]
MGDTANTLEKAPKKSWFKGLKSEFKKIIWPDKESLAKQTVAVVVISTILAVVIGIVDQIIKFGISIIL